MATKTTAASVSAALRKAGVTTVSPSDNNRQGIKVIQGHNAFHVTIRVEIDVEAIAVRRAALVTEALTDLGYTVEANREYASILTVTRP